MEKNKCIIDEIPIHSACRIYLLQQNDMPKLITIKKSVKNREEFGMPGVHGTCSRADLLWVLGKSRGTVHTMTVLLHFIWQQKVSLTFGGSSRSSWKDESRAFMASKTLLLTEYVELLMPGGQISIWPSNLKHRSKV